MQVNSFAFVLVVLVRVRVQPAICLMMSQLCGRKYSA